MSAPDGTETVVTGTNPDTQPSKKALQRATLDAPLWLAPVLETPIRVGKLASVADWHRLCGKVMRLFLAGKIPRETFTGTFFAARIGGAMARDIERVAYIKDIAKRLRDAGVELPADAAWDADLAELDDGQEEPR